MSELLIDSVEMDEGTEPIEVKVSELNADHQALLQLAQDAMDEFDEKGKGVGELEANKKDLLHHLAERCAIEETKDATVSVEWAIARCENIWSEHESDKDIAAAYAAEPNMTA